MTIVPADMRAWQAPSPADILVSELLVSGTPPCRRHTCRRRRLPVWR